MGGSQQVDPVLKEPMSCLCGQREGAVLVVGNPRVPQQSPVLLEVRLLGRAAGPVHCGAGAPARGQRSHTLTRQRVGGALVLLPFLTRSREMAL